MDYVNHIQLERLGVEPQLFFQVVGSLSHICLTVSIPSEYERILTGWSIWKSFGGKAKALERRSHHLLPLRERRDMLSSAMNIAPLKLLSRFFNGLSALNVMTTTGFQSSSPATGRILLGERKVFGG